MAYTVVRGDTLNKIAKDNGMTLAELLKLNPDIKDPDLIHPGDKINVAEGEGGGDAEATPGATTEALPRNALLVNIGKEYRVVWDLEDGLGWAWYKISKEQLKDIYDTETPDAAASYDNVGQFEAKYGNNFWGDIAEVDLKAETPWEDLKERIFNQFGFVAGLDDPGIRRLLIQGYFENWTLPQFQVEYRDTDYYKSTTANQRIWAGLSEPERNARLTARAANLAAEYFNLYGQEIDPNSDEIQDAALRIESGEMPIEQWRHEQRQLAEEVPESPAARKIREEEEAQLAEGNQIENLTALAEEEWRNWVGPIDVPSNFATRWGQDLASGEASEADLQSYLKEVSAGRWAYKPPNLSWADWSSTYKSQIKNTLELGSLDDRDSLLSKVLNSDLTGVDLEQMIRQDDRFKSTRGMFGELSSYAQQLGRDFGFIA